MKKNIKKHPVIFQMENIRHIVKKESDILKYNEPAKNGAVKEENDSVKGFRLSNVAYMNDPSEGITFFNLIDDGNVKKDTGKLF